MRYAVALAGVVALAGCASSTPVVEPFTTPDGKPGHVAYCGGYENQMTSCHEAARKTCGGNYQVLGERESTRYVDNKPTSTMNRRLEFVCSA